MREIGYTLMFFGGGSFLANMSNQEFVILMWIDNWGPEVGWWIRSAMLFTGFILFIASSSLLSTGGEGKGDLESQ